MLCWGSKATSGWELPVLQQQQRPFSLVTLRYVTAKHQEEKSLSCREIPSLKVKKGATRVQVPLNGILSCKVQEQVSFPSMLFSTHPSEQFLVCGKAIV